MDPPPLQILLLKWALVMKPSAVGLFISKALLISPIVPVVHPQSRKQLSPALLKKLVVGPAPRPGLPYILKH